MADLKLYFQNDTTPYTPTTKRGAWDLSTGTAIHGLAEAAGTAGMYAGVAVGSTNADYDVLLIRHVSDPLTADMNFSGNVTGGIHVYEDNAGLNAVLHLHIYVLQGQTDNLRGTALLTDNIGATEFNTLISDAGQAFSATMSAVSALAGDTIVVEVGYRASSTDITYGGRSYHGGTTGTDAIDLDDPSLTLGWINFPYTADSISIERSDAGGAYDVHYTGPWSGTPWTDVAANLTSGVTYKYRTTRTVNGVTSGYSNEVTVNYSTGSTTKAYYYNSLYRD
jgi:hypothetical protein